MSPRWASELSQTGRHLRSRSYLLKPLTPSEVSFQRPGPGQSCVVSPLSVQPESGARAELRSESTQCSQNRGPPRKVRVRESGVLRPAIGSDLSPCGPSATAPPPPRLPGQEVTAADRAPSPGSYGWAPPLSSKASPLPRPLTQPRPRPTPVPQAPPLT